MLRSQAPCCRYRVEDSRVCLHHQNDCRNRPAPPAERINTRKPLGYKSRDLRGPSAVNRSKDEGLRCSEGAGVPCGLAAQGRAVRCSPACHLPEVHSGDMRVERCRCLGDQVGARILFRLIERQEQLQGRHISPCGARALWGTRSVFLQNPVVFCRPKLYSPRYQDISEASCPRMSAVLGTHALCMRSCLSAKCISSALGLRLCATHQHKRLLRLFSCQVHRCRRRWCMREYPQRRLRSPHIFSSISSTGCSAGGYRGHGHIFRLLAAPQLQPPAFCS